MVTYIEHPLIKPNAVEHRAYQKNMAEIAANDSTLVVLPTGMGKTVVALLVIADVMHRDIKKKKLGKILFLAPTKPLVEQHQRFLRQFLLAGEGEICVLTGETAPAKRAEFWKQSSIVVSTPQVIENDLATGRIDLKKVSLIIFDESHRATGNYAYVGIAEHYKEQNKKGLVLGMTASPGGDSKRIEEVSNNLGITRAEIRGEQDPDVKPYVQELEIDWVKIDLPEEAKEIVTLLNAVLMDKVKDLQSCGFLLRRNSRFAKPSTKELLDVQKQIQIDMKTKGQKVPSSLYFAASTQAAALKIAHAVELIETQGVVALRNYLDKLTTEGTTKGGSKAAKGLAKDERVVKARHLADHTGIEHPKIQRVGDIVRAQLAEKENAKIIVFTQYRDTADLLTKELAKDAHIRPVKFIGQASRGEEKGLKQKEQIEIIDKFKNNEFNVLCATSIAEEGLDIPSTDLVIFYEPVPSEIRSIQRRGRTARKSAGRLVILITRATRDEAYYWSSKSKEQKMHTKLNEMRYAAQPVKDLDPFAVPSRPPPPKPKRKKTGDPQTTLGEF